MYNAGLILEGGAMRGVYTCGVIDCFLDNKIEFSSLYGVSAGAGHACNYLSGQRGRAFHAITDYIHGYNYSGLKCFLKTGSLFNMDLIYDKIPHELMYFDNEAFCRSKTRFYAVVTSRDTGEARYMRVTDYFGQSEIVRASGSLPFISPAVEIDGRMYYDGGIADSIPVAKAFADGNKKNVVVLTRDKDYRKTPEHIPAVFKKSFRKKYPLLARAIEERHLNYNGALELIRQKEAEGSLIVIRPKKPVDVKRAETDIKKLEALYNDGYNDAKEAVEKKFPDFFENL